MHTYLLMHGLQPGCKLGDFNLRDFGTENSTLAFMQPFHWRMGGGDHLSGSASFRYGRSTTNQVDVKDCEAYLAWC